MSMRVRGATFAAGLCTAAVLAFSSPTIAGTSYSESVIGTFENSNGLEPTLGTPAFDDFSHPVGVTAEGGTSNAGVIYEAVGPGELNALWSFSGSYPDGQALPSSPINYKGTIFGVSTSALWAIIPDESNFQIVYSFFDHQQAAPNAGVIADGKGNFYGTNGDTIYELTAKSNYQKYKALYTLNGTTDGHIPTSELVRDKTGNLYGVTTYGGDFTNCQPGCGTVFKVTPRGAFSVLCAFTGGSDGGWPIGGLVMDKQGNLYGTTSSGGTTGAGAIYEAPAGGGCKTLYSFGGTIAHPKVDASNPEATLTLIGSTLYGTSAGGGHGIGGTVFSYRIGSRKDNLLWSFCEGGGGNCTDGQASYSGLMNFGGALIGTTAAGGDVNPNGPCGNSGCGTVFELTPQ